MPVPMVPCRRKDDHAVTRVIAATALPHFPGWEPIPPSEDAPADPPGEDAADDPAPAGQDQPRKSRAARSAADSKE
jgi:hypothetical protein